MTEEVKMSKEQYDAFVHMAKEMYAKKKEQERIEQERIEKQKAKVIFKKFSLPMKLLAIWGWISLGLFIALVIGIVYLINKLPSLIPNG